MNIVELELDETLADFEIQDWIDNVFSVQFPEVKAKIKHGCNGVCQKKDEWHEIESKISSKREISKKYMPKNKEKFLLKYHFSGDNEIHISAGYYDPYDFQFHIANNPKHRTVCVIAWKEIE